MLGFAPLCVSAWLLLALPVSRTSALNESVDVLVLLPQNDSYIFSVSRVSPALEYARRRLSTGPFAGLNFTLRYVNSNCGMEALFALVDVARDERPDLIMGPVCEYAAAPVVRVASHWNIPVISAGALASGFSHKQPEYALLTRIAPSYLKMAETFAAMFAHFGWSNAHLIYHDDKDERNCFFTMEGVHILLDGHYDTTAFSVDPKDDKAAHSDDIFKIMLSYQVVIMCLHADVVREVMLMAYRRGLTNSNRLFFNIELFNSSSYGDGSWRRGDKNDYEAKAAYAFLNTVTLMRSTKVEFEDFSLEMRRSQQKTSADVCEGCNDINMFMEGFHDALLLYALALDDAVKSGHSKRNGTEISRRMWNRTFEGIAGQVSVDANGDRNGDFSVISMTNHETGTYETVLNYFGTNGSFQIMPGFSSERFILQGPPKSTTPEHTNKSCGLGLSAATGIIVGGLLGTALLLAFYFFRKNYRITIERRTRREPCDGKHRQLREDSIRSNFSAA